MRKLIIPLCMAVMAIFSSCSENTKPEIIENQTVKIHVTYNLDTSNGDDMKTKASSSEVFALFYEKIKTGEFVAPSYELTFTETTRNESYKFNGKWSEANLITLRTGTYKIAGKSIDYGKPDIQDKASLIFDEELVIDASTTEIVLNADYDCFLLIFAKNNIKSLMNNQTGMGSSSTSFYEHSNYFYAFVKDKLYSDSPNTDKPYIAGIRPNDLAFYIYTKDYNFEKGKYYVYNDVDNNFTIPEMENGVQ